MSVVRTSTDSGWRQHSSVLRYTRATAAGRAIDAYRRLNGATDV